MHKLSRGDDSEQQYIHPASFSILKSPAGSGRIVAGVPHGDPSIFVALIEHLDNPLFMLYVLHTPRGEGIPGRYQSPELSFQEVRGFISKFSSYLSADSRFDLWVFSPSQSATVVWDRHNLLHAYGPLGKFEASLRSLGYEPGQPNISDPHVHHYRKEFDNDARSVLSEFDWHHTPLKPEDEQ